MCVFWAYRADLKQKVGLSPCECPTPCGKLPNVMNPLLTEIAYILDRSGSMQPMQEP
jgi:hypothetical protein